MDGLDTTPKLMLQTGVASVVERALRALMPTDAGIRGRFMEELGFACLDAHELAALARVARSGVLERPHLDLALTEARALKSAFPRPPCNDMLGALGILKHVAAR